jgi:outer membrane protein TolC
MPRRGRLFSLAIASCCLTAGSSAVPAPPERLSASEPGVIYRLPDPRIVPGQCESFDGRGAVEQETLEDAWAMALGVADRLAAAELTVSAAESVRESAFAKRWPTLGLLAGYNVRDNEPAFVLPPPAPSPVLNAFPFEQSEYFSARGRVSWPLYTSGETSSRIDAAESALRAAQSAGAVERDDLKIQVAETYVEVLRSEAELEVAQSHVRSLTAHTKDVESRCKHGAATRYDLLAAQVSLANAQHSTIQAENRLDEARAMFNRRMGKPLSSKVQLAGLDLTQPADDLDTLTSMAIHNRDELAQLSQEAAALREEARMMSAQSGLHVGVVGEYALEENRFVSPQGLASVGVAATWQAFDAGSARHQAEALLCRADALMRLRADLEWSIRIEVRRAWLDVHETARRIEVTRDAIARADENLRIARRQYATGTGTASDALDAESRRIETQRNHSHARYDWGLAVLRLRRASGTL